MVTGDEEFGVDTFFFEEGDIFFRVVPDHVGVRQDFFHVCGEGELRGVELFQLVGDIFIHSQVGSKFEQVVPHYNIYLVLVHMIEGKVALDAVVFECVYQ